MLLTKTLIKINNIWLRFQNRLVEYDLSENRWGYKRSDKIN